MKPPVAKWKQEKKKNSFFLSLSLSLFSPEPAELFCYVLHFHSASLRENEFTDHKQEQQLSNETGLKGNIAD